MTNAYDLDLLSLLENPKKEMFSMRVNKKIKLKFTGTKVFKTMSGLQQYFGLSIITQN